MSDFRGPIVTFARKHWDDPTWWKRPNPYGKAMATAVLFFRLNGDTELSDRIIHRWNELAPGANPDGTKRS